MDIKDIVPMEESKFEPSDVMLLTGAGLFFGAWIPAFTAVPADMVVVVGIALVLVAIAFQAGSWAKSRMSRSSQRTAWRSD